MVLTSTFAITDTFLFPARSFSSPVCTSLRSPIFQCINLCGSIFIHAFVYLDWVWAFWEPGQATQRKAFPDALMKVPREQPFAKG